MGDGARDRPSLNTRGFREAMSSSDKEAWGFGGTVVWWVRVGREGDILRCWSGCCWWRVDDFTQIVSLDRVSIVIALA